MIKDITMSHFVFALGDQKTFPFSLLKDIKGVTERNPPTKDVSFFLFFCVDCSYEMPLVIGREITCNVYRDEAEQKGWAWL